MSLQPRIILRPPPHRDYLQGYPGIPASDPAKDPAPSQDPLLQLPQLLRPQACLIGTVEIRSPPKGPALRAKWLSLELEKIETIPPRASPLCSLSRSGDKVKHQQEEGKYVELIGTGPSRLWVARENHQDAFVVETKKKASRGSPFKKSRNEDAEEDGFDLIPDGNYAFKIPLPEGLPPSTDIDMKSSGISYQLVASLCIKGKKSILKPTSRPTVLVASAPIVLHKADILPVFPAYGSVLCPPIPAKLPWTIAEGLTVGEAKDSTLIHRQGHGPGEGSEGGQLTLKVIRKNSAFGPGDPVQIFVELKWTGITAIRLTRLDFVLLEQITYRYPSSNNSAYLVRSPPINNTLFAVNANGSTVSEIPGLFAALHKNEPLSCELAGTIPASHTRVTVRTAKHIDVSYFIRVRASIEGGDEVVVDQWPVVVGNVNNQVARGIVADIGYVEGLCERPGLAEALQALAPNGNSRSTALTGPLVEDAPQGNVQAFAPISSIPASRSVELATSNIASTGTQQLPDASSYGSRFNLTKLSNRVVDRPESTPERPIPIRPQFAPSPTAEEEKAMYYEAATRSRDHLQRFHHQDTSRDLNSPVSDDVFSQQHHRELTDDVTLSPTSSAALTDTPFSPVEYQEASVLKLKPPFVTNDNFVGSSRSLTGNTVSRSDTILGASGSAVSTSFSEDRPVHHVQPSSSALAVAARSTKGSLAGALHRSLTSAESEKKRLFLEAKEMARMRQEEARLELERQNQVLEDFEFEEAQRDFEEQLIVEAEEAKRREEDEARTAFETRLELERLEKLAQFEREQLEAQAKRQQESDRWARERKIEDEAKRRKAEEFRRMDEQRDREESERRGALARKAAMESQRDEAEQRQLAGERDRREANEARFRTDQLALGEESRSRQQDQRRLQAEHERQQQEDEHRRKVERERHDEEAHRRLYLERLRAEEIALARRDHPNPPNNGGTYPSVPQQRAVSAINRAPSVESFAPSMSAVHADSNYYAQAIASGQSKAYNAAKAEYLRRLRQGQNLANGSSSSRPPQHYQEPTPSFGRALLPQARPTTPQSRSTTPTPIVNGASPSAGDTRRATPEAKSELMARRVLAEGEVAGRQHDGSQGGSAGIAANTAVFDVEGDLAPPPSYPVPSSSVGQMPTKAAAEEKEELAAYHRAKQAVQAARAHQPHTSTSPSPTASDGLLASHQAYPALGYQAGATAAAPNPSAPQSLHQSYPSPESSSSDGFSSGPHPRDPDVAVGKQRAESSNSSYSDSILRSYSRSPPVLFHPQVQSQSNGHSARRFERDDVTSSF